MKILNIGQGYLSYLLALIAIAWGIVGLVAQWIEPEVGIATIYAGLAIFGIRRAIK